jgi:hypothetical protein
VYLGGIWHLARYLRYRASGNRNKALKESVLNTKINKKASKKEF